MPQFLPGATFAGIITVLTVILLRSTSFGPRLSVLKVILIGLAGAYFIPLTLGFLGDTWRATPWLPELPVVTSGQLFLGAWVAFALLFIGNSKGQPRRVPIWVGFLVGVTAAVTLPPLIDWATGSYQRASLRADVNHCTRGMLGEVQPREVTNICDEPITVGLCLPGESNPTPCSQSHTIDPGQIANFDPGESDLSSLPSNLGGLTVVACRPPDRPSRMVRVHGRGHEGVCLPPA
jgi:hypothetical protein